MIDVTALGADTYITATSAAAIIAAVARLARSSSRATARMELTLKELTRTTVRKTQMDLWIARTERELGRSLPPFPRQEEGNASPSD